MRTTCSRQYARIDKALPIRLRVVDQDEAARIGAEILDEPSIRRGLLADLRLPRDLEATWERRALATLLSGMDRLRHEVERLSAIVDESAQSEGEWMTGETVSVSGSGLAVLLPRNLDQDTLVEIDLELREDVGTRMRALGRVASLVLPDGERYPVGRFHLGIAFEAVHEEDRESLIRFTFREQRRTLRRRHAEESEGEPTPR